MLLVEFGQIQNPGQTFDTPKISLPIKLYHAFLYNVLTNICKYIFRLLQQNRYKADSKYLRPSSTFKAEQQINTV